MTQVRPIPEGFHAVTPHLVVPRAKGEGGALDFYERAFGAELLWCHTIEGTDVVMNACVVIGGSPLMLNDEFPDRGVRGPGESTPVTIHLYVDDVDAAWKRAIDAGATEVFPLADQFWGDRYGILRDPFGHQWSLATHVEDVTPEQMEERARAAFAPGE